MSESPEGTKVTTLRPRKLPWKSVEKELPPVETDVVVWILQPGAEDEPEADWAQAYLSETGMWCASEDASAMERNIGWKVTHWLEVTKP
jgi:hypothetical protein